MPRALLALATAAVLLALSASTVLGNTHKSSPDLYEEAETVDPSASFRVLVRRAPGASPDVIAASSGAQLVKTYPGNDRMLLDLPGTDLTSQLEALTQRPDVLYVMPNRKLERTAVSDPGGDPPRLIPGSHVRETTGVESLFETTGLSGSGVRIAVIDSGVFEHEDLAEWDAAGQSRIRQHRNFTYETNGAPHDRYGHGTHVAGLAAGNGARGSNG
ncbi:MAG: S8 family serine peptidase, partial [Acidobacteriota bacterium]|nr:S8 family serine peptidase [Acidobacteriota bacterium]